MTIKGCRAGEDQPPDPELPGDFRDQPRRLDVDAEELFLRDGADMGRVQRGGVNHGIGAPHG